MIERPLCRWVYRVFTRDEWRELLAREEFSGNELDRRDGYIHLSSRAQVPGTLHKYFAGMTDVVVAEIDAALLAQHLRWEASRDDQLFPHLYGNLPASAILRTLDRSVF